MAVAVRYIVNDVEQAISFYRDMLGFSVDFHPAPGFAALSRGDLKLLLNRREPAGRGQAMPESRDIDQQAKGRAAIPGPNAPVKLKAMGDLILVQKNGAGPVPAATSCRHVGSPAVYKSCMRSTPSGNGHRAFRTGSRRCTVRRRYRERGCGTT